jgi:hypothetical protein
LIGTLLAGIMVGPATSAFAVKVKLPAVIRFGSGMPVVTASVYEPASISTVYDDPAVDHAKALAPPVLLPMGYIRTWEAPCAVVPPAISTHIESASPLLPQLVSLVAME